MADHDVKSREQPAQPVLGRTELEIDHVRNAVQGLLKPTSTGRLPSRYNCVGVGQK